MIWADLKLILVEDALYANAPHIREIIEYGWLYVLNVKPDFHQSLEKQFAGRKERGDVKELKYNFSAQWMLYTGKWLICMTFSSVEFPKRELLQRYIGCQIF